jgi:CRISPR/Cas system Type II protein with McrA/HNH and RuvC-like nuclease domain
VIKNIQSKKTYDIDDDVYTFDRMLRKNNANIIQYRMNMYVNDIYANLLNTDVINEYTPRSDSYQKYRYELWAKQNGFDAVSGESISLHEILDEKYHVDHIVPLSKQGSNDISNLRLVSREFNLKKSNKLDEELDMQFSA